MSQFHDLAVRLVLAVMASASTDKISPIDWWPRSKSALETGVAGATDFNRIVSRMARKLQIETLTNASAALVDGIRSEVTDVPAFSRYCLQNALMVVADAQIRRGEEREATGIVAHAKRILSRTKSNPATPDVPVDPKPFEKEIF